MRKPQLMVDHTGQLVVSGHWLGSPVNTYLVTFYAVTFSPLFLESLKRIVLRDSLSSVVFFYERASPKPLTRLINAFRIWLRIRGDIHDSSVVLHFHLQQRVDTPRAESHDSAHYLCIGDLLFKLFSYNSVHHSQRRIHTLHFIYKRESLLFIPFPCGIGPFGPGSL